MAVAKRLFHLRERASRERCEKCFRQSSHKGFSGTRDNNMSCG
uniref:Uncharacterized protein n=1 Tax=Anguilla anguilla TaxID=7936 RepID=A0A0E9WFE0_ANGAN